MVPCYWGAPSPQAFFGKPCVLWDVYVFSKVVV